MTPSGQPNGEWELRGWDEAFLGWFRDDADLGLETMLRVIDWGVQVVINGPPKTAIPGESPNEHHALVPGTDVVVSYLLVDGVVVVASIGRAP